MLHPLLRPTNGNDRTAMTSDTEDHENTEILPEGSQGLTPDSPDSPEGASEANASPDLIPSKAPALEGEEIADPMPASMGTGADQVAEGEPAEDYATSSHDILESLGLGGEPDDDEEEELEPEPEAPIELDFDINTAESLSFTALQEGRAAVFKSQKHKDLFSNKVEVLGTSGHEGRRRGLGLWMLGDYEGCIEQLEGENSATDSAEGVAAVYTRAQALGSCGRHADAASLFQTLTDAHPNEPRPRAGQIEACIEIELNGKTQDTEELSERFSAEVMAAPGEFAQSAEGRYLLGRCAEFKRDWEGALDHYDAAIELCPDYPTALNRFAHLAERSGLDELALNLYRHLVSLGGAERHVLMNLGMLYEDFGRDHDAAACYDIVVNNFPTDKRARLYLADANAGTTMFYDEDMEKKEDRLNQILRIPITDFELSVRARNCLSKMEINTLGDLVMRTEQELLSYKNFGETSLTEIKEILHSKGLRLGMPREEAVVSIEVHANRAASGDRSNVLNKPILELQLSIRARRTVETLGCLTLGDVTKHSAEELLGMPNFGQTSLQELRSKLSEHGIKLKGD